MYQHDRVMNVINVGQVGTVPLDAVTDPLSCSIWAHVTQIESRENISQLKLRNSLQKTGIYVYILKFQCHGRQSLGRNYSGLKTRAMIPNATHNPLLDLYWMKNHGGQNGDNQLSGT